VPWVELEKEQRQRVLDGEGKFLGVVDFSLISAQEYKLHVRVFLSRYRGYSLCSHATAADYGWKRGRSRFRPQYLLKSGHDRGRRGAFFQSG